MMGDEGKDSKIINKVKQPWKYNVCNKSFEYFCHYNRHLKTHTAEKPHKCQLCEKSFASGHLNRHLKTHNGDKPHKCHICQKSFSSGHLNRHLRTHAGEKPYECELCHKSFATNSDLK